MKKLLKILFVYFPLDSVITFLGEYYLLTSILFLFFFVSQKNRNIKIRDEKFNHLDFDLNNHLVILIIFFYCFLSFKQNFLFPSDFVSFNNSLHNDFVSLLAKLIIGISSFSYLVFIKQYLIDKKLNYFEYYILILTSILGFCLLCCSDDLLTAYLAIELQGLAFYVLASFKRSSNYSGESGVKYFILGSFSTLIFLFGIDLVYGLIGSISIMDFKDLFIWIFSANSFFLSFDSISKSLESFQNKTFKWDSAYIKDLQNLMVYEKFELFGSNVTLCSDSDFIVNHLESIIEELKESNCVPLNKINQLLVEVIENGSDKERILFYTFIREEILNSGGDFKNDPDTMILSYILYFKILEDQGLLNSDLSDISFFDYCKFLIVFFVIFLVVL